MSAPHTPEQNGEADWDHRTTVEAARSKIHGTGLPLSLWAETVNHAVNTLNRTLSKQRRMTPYEMWHGTKPDIPHLRIFGSVTYVFIPDAERRKLEPRATKGLYVSESEQQKANLIFITKRAKQSYVPLSKYTNPIITSIQPLPVKGKTNPTHKGKKEKHRITFRQCHPIDGTSISREPTAHPTIHPRTCPKKKWPMESYQALILCHENTKKPGFIFYEPK
jgi:hypothetical protein